MNKGPVKENPHTDYDHLVRIYQGAPAAALCPLFNQFSQAQFNDFYNSMRKRAVTENPMNDRIKPSLK